MAREQLPVNSIHTLCPGPRQSGSFRELLCVGQCLTWKHVAFISNLDIMRSNHVSKRGLNSCSREKCPTHSSYQTGQSGSNRSQYIPKNRKRFILNYLPWSSFLATSQHQSHISSPSLSPSRQSYLAAHPNAHQRHHSASGMYRSRYSDPPVNLAGSSTRETHHPGRSGDPDHRKSTRFPMFDLLDWSG